MSTTSRSCASWNGTLALALKYSQKINDSQRNGFIICTVHLQKVFLLRLGIGKYEAK